jgi:hypothetical protein
MTIWSRLEWLNIAGFLLPAVLAVWLDGRAGRRGKKN